MTDFVLPISHRAKFRASKQLASSNATALIEILGISQSAIPSEAPSQVQSALDTPANSPSPPTPTHAPATQRHPAADDQIRTSTTSVADYFAAKMRARQQVSVTATSTVFQPNESVPVPEPEPEAQDSPEGATPVDEIVVGKKKKEKKRKRKDRVDEKVETYDDDRLELRAESKKRKKKRKME